MLSMMAGLKADGNLKGLKSQGSLYATAALIDQIVWSAGHT